MQEIVGHREVIDFLNYTADSGKVGHAYIFEGISGVGRLTVAKAFAEKIVANKMSFENNPDIKIVTNALYDATNTKTNVLIGTIRSMKSDVYIKPFLSDRKVYIIPYADSMQDAAQNSLLKVFEEPPEYCTIILIANNANALLQTIRSRAVTVKFHPLESELVREYLIEKQGMDIDKAKVLSAMSGGSIGKALMLAEDDEAVELRNTVLNFLINLAENGYIVLYDFIKYLKQNKASIDLITDIMSSFSSDILHLRIGDKNELVNLDKLDELKKFSLRITREAAFRFGEIMIKYKSVISKNANYPIAVSCMATEYWEEIHGRNYRSAF